MFRILRKYRLAVTLKVKSLEADDALHIAETLNEVGLPVMEIMFRRHSDSKAIRAIAEKFPDFWIGAGGIMNRDQLNRAMDAQAKFAMSPGVNLETTREAARRNVMFAPGVCTPTDIENALLNGSMDFQFFPAEQSGGVERLKAILEPFEHLGIDIFAKGGITKDKLKGYLEVPSVALMGLNWIATPEMIEAKAWNKIADAAKEALEIVAECDNQG